MSKNITSHASKDLNKERNEVVVPSSKTLDFLKSFARTYYVDKSLPGQLNNFCIN